MRSCAAAAALCLADSSSASGAAEQFAGPAPLSRTAAERVGRKERQLALRQQRARPRRGGGPAPPLFAPAGFPPPCRGTDGSVELWPQPPTASPGAIAAVPPRELWAECRALRPAERLVPRPDPPCRGNCTAPGAALDAQRCGCQPPPGGMLRSGQDGGGWWVWGSHSREDAALYHHYFCARCNGTFVEMGALDGLRFSNTLFFERALGWRGVLIEALPENIEALRVNRPLSTVVGKAACPDSDRTLQFARGYSTAVGGSAAHASPSFRERWWARGWENRTVTVPCAPLGALLRSAGVRSVDLFVLDVEGGELATLRTMDWTIPVRVWMIELDHHNETKNSAVRRLLRSRGYRPAAGWRITNWCRPRAATPSLPSRMGRMPGCMPNEVFEHPQLVALLPAAAAAST